MSSFSAWRLGTPRRVAYKSALALAVVALANSLLEPVHGRRSADNFPFLFTERKELRNKFCRETEGKGKKNTEAFPTLFLDNPGGRRRCPWFALLAATCLFGSNPPHISQPRSVGRVFYLISRFSVRLYVRRCYRCAFYFSFLPRCWGERKKIEE